MIRRGRCAVLQGMNVAKHQQDGGWSGLVLLLAPVRAVKPPPEAAPPSSVEDWNRLLTAVAKDRDRQAFVLLFKHFAPRLKTYMMRAGAAANTAEEIAQEAMLTVWRKAAYFDASRGAASTWIFTIARNLRIDTLRRKTATMPPDPDPSDEPETPGSSEDAMIAAERHERVRTALRALPPEQSTIVHLSFFEDKPHSEIARQLGLPLGTVKSRIRLALYRFRTLLDDLA
jgi:RNA polymerase sigma-70 factor (ECF subfamily)